MRTSIFSLLAFLLCFSFQACESDTSSGVLEDHQQIEIPYSEAKLQIPSDYLLVSDTEIANLSMGSGKNYGNAVNFTLRKLAGTGVKSFYVNSKAGKMIWVEPKGQAFKNDANGLDKISLILSEAQEIRPGDKKPRIMEQFQEQREGYFYVGAKTNEQANGENIHTDLYFVSTEKSSFLMGITSIYPLERLPFLDHLIIE